MIDRAGDWRFAFQRNRGAAFAALLFAVIFTVYLSNHPAGFSWNVVQTAANKAVLLAFVAAAQSLVVITGGIDLSAGMVLVLCNCLASTVVIGDTPQALAGWRWCWPPGSPVAASMASSWWLAVCSRSSRRSPAAPCSLAWR